MPNNIIQKLNPQQKKAVVHDKGPLLIIAGAGTGKTTVITRRIAHLIVEKKVSPSKILALTFTDKAAFQMQEKVDILVPYGFTDTWISTFHAFGDRILRENALQLGLNPDFRVLTRPQAVVFFMENLFKFDLKTYRPLGVPTKFVNAMVALFSRARDEDISPEEYLNYAQKLKQQSAQNTEDKVLKEMSEQQYELASFYKKFQELMLKESRIDFANQFYLTLSLFRNHPSILKRYQEQFEYILIDEFQDTNYAQFELVKLLAKRTKNITAVADDDQSIYKWRGAAISNMMNFIREYPKAEKIALTQNYRSTQPILDCAYRLIQNNNPERFEVKAKINKKLKGQRKSGPKAKHMHFDSLSAETDWVADFIKKEVKKKKYTYNDFAILVRSNAAADPFLRALNMKGIPWQFSGSQGLYSKDEVRLCISFLRVVANPADSLSLFYLASSLLYKLPIVELTELMNYAKRKQWSLYYTLKKLDSLNDAPELSDEFIISKDRLIRDVEKFIEQSREYTTGRLLYIFLTDSRYIKQLVDDQTASNEDKLKNIAKFFDVVRNFEYVANEDRVLYFVNYLDMLINVGDDPSAAETEIDVNAVNVMTIHKAKGLEFKIVFLVSLIEQKFPCAYRRDPIELPEELIKDELPAGNFHMQEERRLFYVAMTRAEDKLFLTSAVDYGTKQARKISRFISEALSAKRAPKQIKTSALQSIKQHAPRPKDQNVKKKPIRDDQILNLSYYHIDDYITCPMKYKYVHVLCVPIMEHHTVLYGKAIHDAIQHYHQCKIKGNKVTADDIVDVFEKSFVKEGFLSREHIELRLKSGDSALRRFFLQQEKSGIVPAYAEKDFSFMMRNDRIKGRWDRVDVVGDKITIIDFKSSEVTKQEDADKRARDSVQLSLYALSYEKIFGKRPDFKELNFIETGVIGKAPITQKTIEKVLAHVKKASEGIRKGDFEATPNSVICAYCAYNQICPFAVSRQ